MQINLNADLGESFGPWSMGDDDRLLAIVDSANVACGFHAGDPRVMCDTINNAQSHGTSLGAHPGFADLQGFGRRPVVLPANELCALVQYQLAAMEGLCRAAGTSMTHVKPHGAMNNMACEDLAMATTLCEAVRDFDDQLILLAPALSALATAGQDTGLTTALEIFADRAYDESGNLVSRQKPGAVLATAEECVAHVRQMIANSGIVATSGKVLKTAFHSICVHGDNAHAVDTAAFIRKALLADGHDLKALPDLALH